MTYSGKLYKCIVAIGTPEAFNINKWDDVTTSEVYDSKREIISTINSDGVKTYSEIYDLLHGGRTFNPAKDYQLREFNPNTNATITYNVDRVAENFISFTNVSVNAANFSLVEVTLMHNASTAYSNDGTTSTSFASNVVTSGRVFTLIEL